MIFEYALNPNLLSDLNNCRTIFDNFHQENGKLISDSPAKWIQKAFLAINQGDFQPVMKKTLKKNLGTLLKESLVTGRNSSQWNFVNDSWLEYIANEDKIFPYAAVISEENVSSPIKACNLAELFLNAPDCWNYPTQRAIKRNANDIVDVADPLLRISKSITFIEPHFYPRTRGSRNVIIELLTRVDKYNFGKGISKLVINTSDKRLGDMQSSLEMEILHHLPVGFEVIVYMWPENIMHDRFIITEVGGLSFGHGLDEMRPDKVEDVNVKLLDQRSRKKELNLYSSFSNSSGTARIINA